MEDIWKSMRLAVVERTSSPLFGAFAFSWVFWNYKLMIIIFSGMSSPTKISYINNQIYYDLIISLLLLVIGPLVTALIFLFLYPYPAKWVFRFWRKKQKELLDIKRDIENTSQLTVEESRNLRKSIIEIQQEHDSQISRLSSDLDRAKKLLIDEKEIVQKLEDKVVNAQLSNNNSYELTEDELSKLLISMPFRLYFNPKNDLNPSKVMMFGSDGKIIEGNNDNESSWRYKDGKLELIRSNGNIQSRFDYHPKSKLFTHTNDEDTLSNRGQFIIPDQSAAKIS